MKILFVYERGGIDEVNALRQAGHQVDLAGTAEKAYQKLVENEKSGREKYAAAIIHGSDDMPVGEGMTLCEYIRELSPHTLRICYTGQIAQDYRDRFMRRFNIIASKSYGIEGLEALLKKT